MRFALALAATASLALAACGAPAEDTAQTDQAEPTAAATAASPAPTVAASGDVGSLGTVADDEMGLTIPATFHGRWGLVPADCTTTRGDDKGLITVSAQDIRFYESVARLGSVKERSGSTIRATWAFTGEGMTWTRDMALSAQGSDRLVRREYGADAMADALTYTKCS